MNEIDTGLLDAINEQERLVVHRRFLGHILRSIRGRISVFAARNGESTEFQGWFLVVRKIDAESASSNLDRRQFT